MLPATKITDVQKITELFTRVDELALQIRNKNEPYLKNRTRKNHAEMFMRDTEKTGRGGEEER